MLPSRPEDYAAMKQVNFVSGFAWSKNSIVIIIDPSFTEIDVKHTVAHEYHHVVYMETKGSSYFTLLEQSVLEGKADTFAKLIYPEIEVPWIKPFEGEDHEKVWNIFKENLNSTDTEITQDFHNGNARKGIPTWSKYKIGYQIMKSFLDENPDVTLEDWTRMTAKDIYSKSAYKID